LLLLFYSGASHPAVLFHVPLKIDARADADWAEPR